MQREDRKDIPSCSHRSLTINNSWTFCSLPSWEHNVDIISILLGVVRERRLTATWLLLNPFPYPFLHSYSHSTTLKPQISEKYDSIMNIFYFISSSTDIYSLILSVCHEHKVPVAAARSLTLCHVMDEGFLSLRSFPGISCIIN